MSKKCKFPELKAEIKQAEADSKLIRKTINESKGLDRHEAWLKKRSHGDQTRLLLLSYAYLRGVPHNVCEPVWRFEHLWFLQYGVSKVLKRFSFGQEVDEKALDAWLKDASKVVEAAE